MAWRNHLQNQKFFSFLFFSFVSFFNTSFDCTHQPPLPPSSASLVICAPWFESRRWGVGITAHGNGLVIAFLPAWWWSSWVIVPLKPLLGGWLAVEPWSSRVTLAHQTLLSLSRDPLDCTVLHNCPPFCCSVRCAAISSSCQRMHHSMLDFCFCFCFSECTPLKCFSMKGMCHRNVIHRADYQQVTTE